MRATIAWSYELLDPEERTLFRRLAPFRGCTLDAVARACVMASEGPRSASVDLPPLSMDARDALASLVDKSLLRVDTDEQGQAWYVTLETVREFALEHLEASPEADGAWRRHAWYYLQLAEQQTGRDRTWYARTCSSAVWSVSMAISGRRSTGVRRTATRKPACGWPLGWSGSGSCAATLLKAALAWSRCWPDSRSTLRLAHVALPTRRR